MTKEKKILLVGSSKNFNYDHVNHLKDVIEKLQDGSISKIIISKSTQLCNTSFMANITEILVEAINDNK